MPSDILITNGAKYQGKYVATRSFKNKKVLCAGKDPLKVFNRAKKQGASNPVVTFIPQKGIIHIY
jgi:hypothetical protein